MTSLNGLPKENFVKVLSNKHMEGLRKPARDGSQEVLRASRPHTERGPSNHQNSARPVAIGEAGDNGALKGAESRRRRVRGESRGAKGEYTAKCSRHPSSHLALANFISPLLCFLIYCKFFFLDAL